MRLHRDDRPKAARQNSVQRPMSRTSRCDTFSVYPPGEDFSIELGGVWQIGRWYVALNRTVGSC